MANEVTMKVHFSADVFLYFEKNEIFLPSLCAPHKLLFLFYSFFFFSTIDIALVPETSKGGGEDE